jgi:DNA-binding NtrC family response regulator
MAAMASLEPPPPVIECRPFAVPSEPAIVVFDLGEVCYGNRDFLDEFSHWKRAGCPVIALADGMSQRTIGEKCLLLLSGATHLVDAAQESFADQLRRALAESQLALMGKRREWEETCALMQRHGLIGHSAALTQAFQSARRFSQLSDLPVLITGDTGVGKELVARALVGMDPKRGNGPFLPVNCAAITPTLMESEFFGHRRGAFTGADRERLGLIRAAEGGTLFLDEIGDLAMELQTKLLRVLQDNRVLALGDDRERPVDIRVIAATNGNLDQLVAEGRFRADLLHRLRVLSIHIPPLRDRASDLIPLVQHFVTKHRALHPSFTGGVSRDFLTAMQALELPGNVRQLENIVRRALANHPSAGDLELSDLPEDALRDLTERPGPLPEPVEGPAPSLSNGPATDLGLGPGETRVSEIPRDLPLVAAPDLSQLAVRLLDSQGWNLTRAIRECERQMFHVALDRAQGNQSQAARLLGITPRSVYNKLHKHGLGLHPD